MRLAVLSEIHATQEALLAVLEDLRTQEKNEDIFIFCDRIAAPPRNRQHR